MLLSCILHAHYINPLNDKNLSKITDHFDCLCVDLDGNITMRDPMNDNKIIYSSGQNLQDEASMDKFLQTYPTNYEAIKQTIPINTQYTLCIDVGNSCIHGSLYHEGSFSHYFEINTSEYNDNQLIKNYFIQFFKEQEIAFNQIRHIGISSVVPSLNAHLEKACFECFNTSPVFISSKNKTGLLFQYPLPEEIGADLICSAVGAAHLWPNTPCVIIDMGTATTITAVNKDKSFITGLIFPGLKTQLNSLCQSAEQLSQVPLAKPPSIIGITTTECIQNGLYYSHLGALTYASTVLSEACFDKTPYKIIGTGGLSHFFKGTALFDHYEPNLVLIGLVEILKQSFIDPIS